MLAGRRMTRTMLSGALAALLAAGLAAPAGAAKRGRVAKVIDGDSVRLTLGGTTRTYGLRGVRAPARGECHGTTARRALRKLLPRRARVKVSGRGRSVTIRRRGALVNAAMVRRGHARARGARWRSAEGRARTRGLGLWGGCAEAPGEATPGPGTPTPPPTSPGPADKQQTIAALDQLLQGVGVYTTRSSGGTTDTRTAHLCPDHRFVYRSQTQIVDSGGSFSSGSASAGTWKVVDALVDPAGQRQAIVETVADQGDAAGQTTRTLLQINADGSSGRWDDQAASFFRSDQC